MSACVFGSVLCPQSNAVGAVYFSESSTVLMYNSSITGSLPALMSLVQGADLAVPTGYAVIVPYSVYAFHVCARLCGQWRNPAS